ncbi:hypothetical protein SAMN05216360_115142 [Methylobacterium phyllostachyos]|uniref:Uncharacterized protein n=1 Tax=Methylobacterium phyllostachyos TaxID=582672 RepID=A0A1H0H8G2_9HYPH|nr:hypothetical protein SAMN05216360_115142 [Methylobacterium phyllostachyos]
MTRAASPSPLCGGGYPAQQGGRGEPGFRKGRGLHGALSLFLHRRSPLPTLANARPPLPRRGGRGVPSRGDTPYASVDREAA